MPELSLSLDSLSYFSELIKAYLREDSAVRPFYHRFPKLENFEAQLLEKKNQFSAVDREVLVNTLFQQYDGVEDCAQTKENIALLSKENTFTITTGHQLNIFTGPLYFFYKIISTLNLVEILRREYPDRNFVPIYWMASEDHDFEEINNFQLFGKKLQWNAKTTGAVGPMSTLGLDKLGLELQETLGNSRYAHELQLLFEAAYTKHQTLAEAMRYLVHSLFGTYGLVILDGNAKSLKKRFIPYIKEELDIQLAKNKVSGSSAKLKQLGYKAQVHPRAINLFYLKDHIRSRILKNENQYRVKDTAISWDKKSLWREIDQFPERFSPNVIMRPLYQEVVLPNLCYIGGGGELAYWLQLKTYFEKVQVPFPLLLLRNSVLLINKKQRNKLHQLKVAPAALFLSQQELVDNKVRQISDIPINFEPQKEHLKAQFAALYEMAKRTDKSFLNAVKAQEAKQIKGLVHLEKRLLRAQKNKCKDQIHRLVHLQAALFPNGNLQERISNFSEFYLEHGEALVPKLKKCLNPLKKGFLVLTL